MLNAMVSDTEGQEVMAHLPVLQSRPASRSTTPTGWISIIITTITMGGCAASCGIFTPLTTGTTASLSRETRKGWRNVKPHFFQQFVRSEVVCNCGRVEGGGGSAMFSFFLCFLCFFSRFHCCWHYSQVWCLPFFVKSWWVNNLAC